MHQSTGLNVMKPRPQRFVTEYLVDLNVLVVEDGVFMLRSAEEEE